jgi:hypothetical protein
MVDYNNSDDEDEQTKETSAPTAKAAGQKKLGVGVEKVQNPTDAATAHDATAGDVKEKPSSEASQGDDSAMLPTPQGMINPTVQGKVSQLLNHFNKGMDLSAYVLLLLLPLPFLPNPTDV